MLMVLIHFFLLLIYIHFSLNFTYLEIEIERIYKLFISLAIRIFICSCYPNQKKS